MLTEEELRAQALALLEKDLDDPWGHGIARGIIELAARNVAAWVFRLLELERDKIRE